MHRTSADLRSLEIPGIAHFQDEPGGLVSLAITAPACSARLFTHGAHLAEWTPAGMKPVLFMSNKSHFAPGKAIRGGVPICFPWFAARSGHPESPAHGTVRTAEWEIESLAAEPDGSVKLSFSICDSDGSRALWPHAFRTRFQVHLGRTLEMNLEVENTGGEAFTFEEALHTYFCVSDVRNIEIKGLEGAEYIDKTDAFARKRRGPSALRFAGETDSVFPGTLSPCILHDPGFRRDIVVEKAGSKTTVVWNPWIAKAAAMADFGDEEWPGMACIETANAGEDALTLNAGAKHTMTTRIALVPH